MKKLKTIIGFLFILLMLAISVNAEDTFDMFLNITLDLETGETSFTPTEITGENDFSNLYVSVIEVTSSGTENEVYKGKLSDYDEGRWVNVDFSDNKPFLIYDWQEMKTYWVVPVESSDAAVYQNLGENTVLESFDGDLDVDIRLIYNNEYYEAALMPNNTLNLSIDIANSGASRDLICYIAEYDTEGRMLELSSDNTISVPAGEGISASIIKTFSNSNTASAKVFLWEANTLKPITSNIILQTQQADYYADTYETAQSCDVTKVINGRINSSSDVDYIKFVPISNGKYIVHTISTSNVSGGLYDSQNNLIADGILLNGGYYCEAELVSGNTYYLKTNGNEIGEYNIMITKMEDDGLVEITNNSIKFTQGCNNSSQAYINLYSDGTLLQSVTATPSNSKVTAEFDVSNLQSAYTITVVENGIVTSIYDIKLVIGSNTYNVTEKSYVSIPVNVSNVSNLSDIYFSVAFNENEFNVFDACEHTYTSSETGTGHISSAEVNIKAIENNAVVFTSTKTITESWNGTINIVKLQAVETGEYTVKTIAYSVK